MTKVATTIEVEVNNPIEIEDTTISGLIPLLKSAVFPGNSVLPKRKLIVIIEVLEES